MLKRVCTIISLLLALNLLLVACGSPAPAAPTAAPTVAATTAPTSSAPQPTASAQPMANHPFKPVYLTVNMEQQSTWVRNFNPFSGDARMQATTIIYEPMMIYDKATSQLVPWLATAYAWNSDNTLLTFTLRQGVKWSDGQPFTSKDVTFTFDLLNKYPALLNNLGSILTDDIDSWSAPDDFTVQFKFKVVYTPALHLLANQLIVPEHIWKDVADPTTYTNDTPVGTGPFTEVTKFQDQTYTLEKNPYYWQPGKPAFQGMIFPAYPGNDQANMALVQGDLDWAGNFVPDIEKTYISKDPTDFHYFFVGAESVMLYINPSIKPFDNPDVRKAISMGIDRQSVVDIAEYGYIAPSDATGLSVWEYKPWINPDAVAAGTWTSYDPQKANAMLDAAGLKKGTDGIRIGPDGNPMSYKLLAPNGWTDWIAACQIISQNMKDLGITIALDNPEQDSWQDEVFSGKFQWTLGWSSGGATPYYFYRGQMSQLTVQPVGQPANENWGRYVDPQADKLLAQFATTSDPAQQKSLMNQIETIFVNDAPCRSSPDRTGTSTPPRISTGGRPRTIPMPPDRRSQLHPSPPVPCWW